MNIGLICAVVLFAFSLACIIGGFIHYARTGNDAGVAEQGIGLVIGIVSIAWIGVVLDPPDAPCPPNTQRAAVRQIGTSDTQSLCLNDGQISQIVRSGVFR